MPKIKPTAVAAAVDTVRVNIESRSAVFNCRTDKEIEYLNNAVNRTDKHKEMMT